MNELSKQETTETTRLPHRNGGTATLDKYVTPRSSVYDTADAVLVELEMPGVGRDNIDITVDKDELTVTVSVPFRRRRLRGSAPGAPDAELPPELRPQRAH